MDGFTQSEAQAHKNADVDHTSAVWVRVVHASEFEGSMYWLAEDTNRKRGSIL